MSSMKLMKPEATEEQSGDPLDWLLIYSIEIHGGIDDAWLEQSGMQRSEAEQILRDNPAQQREVRRLIQIGRLLTLENMFEMLRQRCLQLLSSVQKPTEIRSLLGSLGTLRSMEFARRREEQRQLLEGAKLLSRLEAAVQPAG
ncbi:MAG: hypothetical protein R3F46_14050 [bacterium]